ncbi:MAG: magnesium and cobalt transport protein CorA [Azoarcus sp.]|jgi:magnesium transporter|nr:magnesium and cobalt transport protein CorA [Azoarcus sp.]
MLLHCTAYQHGQRLAELDIAHIGDYLNLPECFIWVALRDACADELAQMQAAFKLHELAVEDANHGHQRPKIEEYDNEIFAVMHLIEETQKNDPEGKNHASLRTGEMHVFAGGKYIISIQNNYRDDLSSARARCERNPKSLAHGPGYVFYTLIDTVVDCYFPLIEQLEGELEKIEERIFTHGDGLSGRANTRRLYRLKRKVTVLKHAVTPLMEAIGKLHSGSRVPPVCGGKRHHFRDVYDHLQRLNASLDGIRDTLATAIQVNLALVTIDQTEVSKRLAAWAGIFAVITAFAGIWGMNFTHMPELAWEFGYPAALMLIAITAMLLYRRFRKAHWL